MLHPPKTTAILLQSSGKMTGHMRMIQVSYCISTRFLLKIWRYMLNSMKLNEKCMMILMNG